VSWRSCFYLRAFWS